MSYAYSSFLQDLLKTHTKFVGKLEKGCSNGGMQISPVFLEFVCTHTVHVLVVCTVLSAYFCLIFCKTSVCVF